MKITEVSIKRPVAVTMIVLLFILLGIMGRMYLGADLFPKVNIPVVVISTLYPGAGAEEIEKDIIKPTEDAVSSISGVDKISSTASEGYASTVVMFKMSADTSSAVMDTQKAIDSLSNRLPKDASRPTLYKYEQDATPILVVTLSGEKPFEELYNEAETLKERIERVQGVGMVSIFGGREKEVEIKVDKAKLDFYGLSLSQITNRLQLENLNMPGGTINQAGQDKIVRVQGEFDNINDIKSLRIPLSTGSYIQLSDVAEISLEYPKVNDMSRANGTTAIGLSIQKQSDANIVETGKKAKNEINKLKNSFKGTEVELVQDSTVFITSSLDETQKNLIEGVLTTAIVLFFFLRQWTSVFMVMIAIPTSLISTFFMMYMFGFTFNMLSLMGLALCVGILVDDSVVVLENIHRHLSMGKDSKTAALEGRSEIGMAAIAITLCDVVVFAPIAFMSGMVGQYFKQFGLTVVFATMFSLLVSFTLTPMMASRLFKKNGEGRKSKFVKATDNIGITIKRGYQFLLLWALNNRYKVIGFILVLIIFAVSLIPLGVIGAEFMPGVDSGELEINMNLTPGSTIEKTDVKTKMVEEYVKTIPELKYFYTKIGGDSLPNKAYMYVKLIEKEKIQDKISNIFSLSKNKQDKLEKRKRSQKQIVEDIRNWGNKNLSGVDFSVNEVGMADTGNGNKPIVVQIKGSKTEVIKEIANKVEEIVKSTPGTTDIGNTLDSGQPEINVKVDRIAATSYGVSAYDISNVVRSSIEGAKAGVYRIDGEEYDIRIKLADNQVLDLNDVGELKVINNAGQLIPINQVAKVSLTESPTVIKRSEKQRMGTINANLQKGYIIGNVNTEIQKKIDALSIPDGYSVSMSGEQEDMVETFTALIQALILSVALVYMILVVLYESFLTPLVRILALPVGMVGALLMLALTGKSLNMFSMIGLIMLDGLAAKNGTLLIDYTNTLMRRGLSLREALFEAGSTRLRPIMMTSLAMIVGMLPTALSLGDGSEYKSGMAVVIIGGMITSTLFSPILLPVAYTLIDDFQNWAKKTTGWLLRIIRVRTQAKQGEEA